MKVTKPYKEIWETGTVPKVTDLVGEYKVKMLSGPFLWLNILGDVKYFFLKEGYNTLGGLKDWGYFRLQVDSEKLIINYNMFQNGLIVRDIRDYIRQAKIGKYYIGKFNIVFRGKVKFLGYFTLSKKGGYQYDKV